MFRYALLFIIGILAFAWVPQAEADSLLGLTAACTKETLSANHLSYRQARRLAIGRVLMLDGLKITLERGDTVWGLCKAAKAAPRITPAAEYESQIKELEKRVAEEGAQVVAARQETADARREAADARLAAAEARADNARARTREDRFWFAIAGLTALSALLAIALAYFAMRSVRSIRAIYAEVERAEGLRGTLRKLLPFLTLDGVSYTLATDAVTESASVERRTFLIELTKISRQESEKIEIYCRLPWGQQSPYDPSRLERLIRSDEAKTFYARERNITLREEVFGRRLIVDALPDYYALIAAAAACVWQNGLRFRSATPG